MGSHVDQATFVYRRWDKSRGLQETERSFASLDDLFDLCLTPPDDNMADRIVLQGIAADGTPRSVVLNFQSASG